MMYRTWSTALIVLGFALLSGNVSQVATGQSVSFRIETDVFAEGQSRPILQSLTLFHESVAYDFTRGDEANCTLVDPAHDRIVLLNTRHQLRTELSINEINQLIESAKVQAAGTPLALFLVGAAKVEVANGVVTVGDEHLRYRATTEKPPQRIVAQEYRRFADAMANFNAWAFGGTPPYARLALNKAVADLDALPVEIRRTIKVGKETVTHISRLHPTWLLSKTDKLRISETQKGLVAYTKVDLATFQSRTQGGQVAKEN